MLLEKNSLLLTTEGYKRIKKIRGMDLIFVNDDIESNINYDDDIVTPVKCHMRKLTTMGGRVIYIDEDTCLNTMNDHTSKIDVGTKLLIYRSGNLKHKEVYGTIGYSYRDIINKPIKLLSLREQGLVYFIRSLHGYGGSIYHMEEFDNLVFEIEHDDKLLMYIQLVMDNMGMHGIRKDGKLIYPLTNELQTILGTYIAYDTTVKTNHYDTVKEVELVEVMAYDIKIEQGLIVNGFHYSNQNLTINI